VLCTGCNDYRSLRDEATINDTLIAVFYVIMSSFYDWTADEAALKSESNDIFNAKIFSCSYRRRPKLSLKV